MSYNTQNYQNQHQQNGKGMATSRMATTNLGISETSLNIPIELQSNCANGRSDKDKLGPEAYCCCGLAQLRHTALGIAVLELLIFGYQLITSTMELFVTPIASVDQSFSAQLQSTSSSISSLLTLLFLLLTVTAILLLLLGVFRRSPFMLLPHMLVQFILLIVAFLIAFYVAAWLLGGINLRISAIFFEQSPNGEQSIDRANQKPPLVEANFTITHMQIALASLLLLIVLAIFLQIWLIHIILRTFRYLLHSQNSVNNTVIEIRSIPMVNKDKRVGISNCNGHLPIPVPKALPSSPPTMKVMPSAQSPISSPLLTNTNTRSTTATNTNSSSTNSSPPPAQSVANQKVPEKTEIQSTVEVQPTLQVSQNSQLQVQQQHSSKRSSKFQSQPIRPEVQV